MSNDRIIKLKAPEITKGLEWINTDKPITIASLKGKIILLDFWTFCCINCMHIIPDLKKLEKEFDKNLVVIGVHSAKFENERITENIRNAVIRYEIKHPVVNDKDRIVWDNYAVNAWPTLVLIDPEGYIVGGVSGEGNYEILRKAIIKIINDSKYESKLNNTPLSLALEKKEQHTALKFPGKIISNDKDKTLYISDSNNNRVIIAAYDGAIIDIIGSGKEGKTDGGFDNAQFNHQQGLALKGDSIYIADTENHLIRKADLKSRIVSTIAGTGNQGSFIYSESNAMDTSLNSPWDLTIINDTIYIAMAGAHQIWKLDIKKNKLLPYAGSGRENISDNFLQSASLAQPSGITYIGDKIYIADSETSSIRELDINENKGMVKTIVGIGLFDFGDTDGTSSEVRLQHPLGITSYGENLLIADTYNHKIKLINPKEKTSKTIFGSGKSGLIDGNNAEFFEPAGLCAAGNKIFIADTNNSLIRVADLDSKTVSSLNLRDIKLPEAQVKHEFKPITLQKTTNAVYNLIIDVKLPQFAHFTPDTMVSYSIISTDNTIMISDKLKKGQIKPEAFPYKIPFSINLDKGKSNAQIGIKVEINFLYCVYGKYGLCNEQKISLSQPVNLSSNPIYKETKDIYLFYKLE